MIYSKIVYIIDNRSVIGVYKFYTIKYWLILFNYNNLSKIFLICYISYNILKYKLKMLTFKKKCVFKYS